MKFNLSKKITLLFLPPETEIKQMSLACWKFYINGITSVFMPGVSHGQSLVGYGPQGRRVGHNWSNLAYHVLFHVWLLPFNIMIIRLIQVLACSNSSFSLLFIVYNYMNMLLFIHELFPVLNHEYCCQQYVHTCLLNNMPMHFYWISILYTHTCIYTRIYMYTHTPLPLHLPSPGEQLDHRHTFTSSGLCELCLRYTMWCSDTSIPL